MMMVSPQGKVTSRAVAIRVGDELVALALRAVLIENYFPISDDIEDDCVLVTDDMHELSEMAVFVAGDTAVAAKSAVALLKEGRLRAAIPKDRPRDLPAAINSLLAGFIGMSAALYERSAHVPELGTRELEILNLIMDGATNSRIAEKLNLSEATVKREVSALLDVFQANSRINLAQRASVAGL